MCKCGVIFGTAGMECEECKREVRIAKPSRCVIMEAPGRCKGYMLGICERCLDFCAEENWKGWKSVECEWWTGIKVRRKNESRKTVGSIQPENT
jgi:hypothetical protein